MRFKGITGTLVCFLLAGSSAMASMRMAFSTTDSKGIEISDAVTSFSEKTGPVLVLLSADRKQTCNIRIYEAKLIDFSLGELASLVARGNGMIRCLDRDKNGTAKAVVVEVSKNP